MRLDDLRKLATGKVLFSLDRTISPLLVRVLYLLGLAGLLVWAIRHLFASFRWGFGSGLWGVIEIAVFGLILFVALRIACEAILVYFRDHAADSEVAPLRSSRSLLDDVREAIEELADEEPDQPPARSAPAREWTTPRNYSAAPDTAVTPPASETLHNRGVAADIQPEYPVPPPTPETPEAPAPRRPSTEPGASFS